MILVVAAAQKEGKKVGKEIIYRIKDQDGEWWDFHGGFSPAKGQSLNVRPEEKTSNGKTYKHAHLIEPPPPQGAITPVTTANGNARPVPPVTPAPAPSYVDFKKAEAEAGMATRGKAKWSEWCEMANAANELARKLENEPAAAYARMKFVNTTLMEYAKGNLELPTEAGPAEREPGDDDDAYADPNKTVTPWGN